jgi:hypothetical protein
MPAPIKHTFDTHPLTPDDSPAPIGRPPKPKMPRLPRFEISDYEREWFDYFQAVYRAEYPDLNESDRLLLFLAGIEFLKYLRVAGEELASGEVISQARQHPGNQMNALLDRLSVTRKARERKPKEEDDPNADLLLRLAQ